MMLEDYGLEEIGRWHTNEKIKSGVDFNITKNERVVYAFVVADEAKYIGICEKYASRLGDRLKEYKYLRTKSEERIANQIRRCLEEKKDVRIYALKPELECKYKDLDVDLVKGLENPLIKKSRPEWNVR